MKESLKDYWQVIKIFLVFGILTFVVPVFYAWLPDWGYIVILVWLFGGMIWLAYIEEYLPAKRNRQR